MFYYEPKLIMFVLIFICNQSPYALVDLNPK